MSSSVWEMISHRIMIQLKKFGTTMLYIRQKIPMMVFVLQLVKNGDSKNSSWNKRCSRSTDKWSCFGFV